MTVLILRISSQSNDVLVYWQKVLFTQILLDLYLYTTVIDYSFSDKLRHFMNLTSAHSLDFVFL